MNVEQLTVQWVEHVEKVLALSEAGEIQWRPLETPKPEAMRAFEGSIQGYTILVTQANMEDGKVIHRGVLTVFSGGPNIIMLPEIQSNILYHHAATKAN